MSNLLTLYIKDIEFTAKYHLNDLLGVEPFMHQVTGICFYKDVHILSSAPIVKILMNIEYKNYRVSVTSKDGSLIELFGGLNEHV